MSRAHRRDKYAPRGRDTRGTLARAISSTLLPPLPSHRSRIPTCGRGVWGSKISCSPSCNFDVRFPLKRVVR